LNNLIQNMAEIERLYHTYSLSFGAGRRFGRVLYCIAILVEPKI
jgi:hypothetical protein